MSSESDFWSRRKAGVREEEERARKETVVAQDAESLAELEALPDEEILTRLDLPDPDTLKAGDDFSAFMARAVPERLRRRALRKLWLSNPALANLDELIDYGEDYTDAARVIDNLQTTYQVGKGMLKHVLEMERQEAREPDPEPDEMSQEGIETCAQDTSKMDAQTQISDDAMDMPDTIVHDSAEPELQTNRRRMRFVFDEGGAGREKTATRESE